jgi:hypothetical protein
VVLQRCDASGSKLGNGRQSTKQGTLALVGTNVHHERRLVVVIGEGGGREGRLVHCAVQTNGQMRIQVEGGSIGLDQCQVRKEYSE